MTDRPAGDFILAADMAGLGFFAPAGLLCEPSLALTTAVREFQVAGGDTDRRNALIYAIGTRIAGRCILINPETASIVQTWLSARIVAEWRITIPRAGRLQASFLISRLRRAEKAEGQFDFALQLAGLPCFDAFEAGRAAVP